MISTSPIADFKTWEDFMAKHPEANFLQSWYWGEFHKSLGRDVIRLGFYKNKSLVGICQAVVETAKSGKRLVVAGGPILDWTDQKQVQAWIDVLKTEAKARK